MLILVAARDDQLLQRAGLGVGSGAGGWDEGGVLGSLEQRGGTRKPVGGLGSHCQGSTCGRLVLE